MSKSFEAEMAELCEGPEYGGAGEEWKVEKGLPEFVEGSKPLGNPRHERWCHLVVAGKRDSVAYREAFKCSVETAESGAWLLRRDSGVSGRLIYLLEQVSLGSVLSVKERREFLASVVRTPVGEIDEHSPLAQEVVYDESERGSRTKVKMPGKLEALKLDAEMAGELGIHQQAAIVIPIQLNVHVE